MGDTSSEITPHAQIYHSQTLIVARIYLYHLYLSCAALNVFYVRFGTTIKPIAGLAVSALAFLLDLTSEETIDGDTASTDPSGPTRRYGADIKIEDPAVSPPPALPHISFEQLLPWPQQ